MPLDIVALVRVSDGEGDDDADEDDGMPSVSMMVLGVIKGTSVATNDAGKSGTWFRNHPDHSHDGTINKFPQLAAFPSFAINFQG